MRITLELAYAKCRSTHGHKWDDYVPGVGSKQAAREKRERWGYRCYFLCERCATVKTMVWDARGEVSERHYDYPDGYSLTKDETPERAALRVYTLKRMKADAEARVSSRNGHSNGNGKRAKPRTATRRKQSHHRTRARA